MVTHCFTFKKCDDCFVAKILEWKKRFKIKDENSKPTFM